MHALFDAAGLNEDNELRIALRGVDALGADSKIFLGNKNLFTQQAILQKITLPEGSWQIAAFFIIFRANQHHKQALIHKKLVKRNY